MPDPNVELIPLKNALRSDAPTTLDVLVRITPPVPEVHFVRPGINLGLVLDRSGSMSSGKKMAHAREAAAFAVQQLLPEDRVSVTVFDDSVATIAPNAPAADKAALIARIMAIAPGGATALHAGWSEGARQVEENWRGDGLNRVILLSDGQANHGLIDPNAIASEARGLAARGVGTTTMGLGADYNEALMQAMAEAGDGSYYFVESPVQLADIFHTEMQGLMANLGQKVSLGLEPARGVAVVEVLNDLARNDRGRYLLPNLIVGMPILVVVRLQVPAAPREAEVCRVRVAWDDPREGVRRATHAALGLASCPSSRWDALPADPAVAEQVVMQMAVRARKEAIASYDAGNLQTTYAHVIQAHALLGTVPTSEEIGRALREVRQLQADLDQGDGTKFRKRGSHQAYWKGSGRES